MADTKFSALPAVTTLTGASEMMLNEAGTSKRFTVDQFVDFDRKIIAGDTGTANANAAPQETWQILTAEGTYTLAAMTVMITTSALPAGTYFYRYDIIARCNFGSYSINWAVDSTATVTKTVWHVFYPSQGVAAATGIADQDVNATTGAVWAHFSSRTDNATVGPGTGVDTASADIHYVIEGVLVTSTSGDLTVAVAPIAGGNQVRIQSGTMLRLSRLA